MCNWNAIKKDSVTLKNIWRENSWRLSRSWENTKHNKYKEIHTQTHHNPTSEIKDKELKKQTIQHYQKVQYPTIDNRWNYKENQQEYRKRTCHHSKNDLAGIYKTFLLRWATYTCSSSTYELFSSNFWWDYKMVRPPWKTDGQFL